eukprot:GDKJ01036269.1.p1 GENE.GDKJ01036269.1~~GDKJ01036269.1.p1  ORF type:complete len:295 (+),score=63.44 GDKJ01036269.1:93-887(+)
MDLNQTNASFMFLPPQQFSRIRNSPVLSREHALDYTLNDFNGFSTSASQEKSQKHEKHGTGLESEKLSRSIVSPVDMKMKVEANFFPGSDESQNENKRSIHSLQNSFEKNQNEELSATQMYLIDPPSCSALNGSTNKQMNGDTQKQLRSIISTPCNVPFVKPAISASPTAYPSAIRQNSQNNQNLSASDVNLPKKSNITSLVSARDGNCVSPTSILRDSLKHMASNLHSELEEFDTLNNSRKKIIENSKVEIHKVSVTSPSSTT